MVKRTEIVSPDSTPSVRAIPKVKTRGEAAPTNEDPISVPDSDEAIMLKRKVDYTEAQLRGYLPRNTTEGSVEQLMKIVHGFEIGRINPADRIPQAGDDVWELKSKGSRLLMKHAAGRNWSIVNAGFRGDDDRVFRKKR